MPELTMTIEDLLEGLPSVVTKPLTSPVGRAYVPLEVCFERNLEASDLALPTDPSQCVPIHIKSLRDRHHDLAKAIAEGDRTHTAISKETGYTMSRISILMTDPAFLELVENYRGTIKEVFRGSQQRLADLMRESADIMLERLDENPDAFSVANLLDIIKTTADRTGDGPTSTTRIEASLSVATSEDIAAIKAKVKERQNGRINRIEQEAIDVEIIDSDGGSIGHGRVPRLETPSLQGFPEQAHEDNEEGAVLRAISGPKNVEASSSRKD